MPTCAYRLTSDAHAPAYPVGTVIFVDDQREPAEGDDCLFRAATGELTGFAVIGPLDDPRAAAPFKFAGVIVSAFAPTPRPTSEGLKLDPALYGGRFAPTPRP